MRGGVRRINGTDIIAFVATIDHIPLETNELHDVSSLLDRSHNGMLHTDLVWRGEERYLKYRKFSTGKHVLIPLYRWFDGETLLLDHRDYEFIQRDSATKKSLVNLDQAKEIMVQRGVNLKNAEMLANLNQKVQENAFGPYIRYTSPDGRTHDLKLVKHVREARTGWRYFVSQFDLCKWIEQILEDQKRFIRYTDARNAEDLNRIGASVLSEKPRDISYDTETRSIRLYTRNHDSWIDRSDWDFYLTWKRFMDLKNNGRYVAVKKAVCRAFDREQWDANYDHFLEGIYEIGSDNNGMRELAVSLSSEYGIWLRVHELEGVWYVGQHYVELAKFAMNAGHDDGRVRAKCMNELERELAEFSELNRFTFAFAVRMWIARGILMRDWRDESARAKNSEAHFDRVLCSEEAKVLFSRFSMKLIEELLSKKEGDLRYVPARVANIGDLAFMESPNSSPYDLYAPG